MKKHTLENVLEICKEYNSRTELHKKRRRAFYFLKNNYPEILDKIFPLKVQIWDYEYSNKEAKKYKTKSDFQKFGKGAYLWAKRNGVFKEFCSHMIDVSYDFTFSRWCGNNEYAIFYVLKCKDYFKEEPPFFKIGITVKSVKERYEGNTAMPYEWKCMLEIKDTSRVVWNTEKYMLRELKQYKYIPEIEFGGYARECFCIPEKQLLSYFSLV
jgi:hypothetical protein